MLVNSFSAWLLHKQPRGDSSYRLFLFCKELGVLTGVYRGGRALKKAAVLQNFTPLWLTVSEKNQYHYINQVEQQGAPLVFAGNTLFAAIYLNELLYICLKQNDSCPELYAKYQHTLNALTMASELSVIEILLRRFEWQLLKTCGYEFSFTHEADSQRPLNASACYKLIIEKGFVQAEVGFQGSEILTMVDTDFADITSLKAAKKIMRLAINHLLNGRELKSRQLFQKN